MLFTLEGDAVISDTHVPAKTAAKLGNGDVVTIEACDEPIEIIYICSEKLGEPIAWGGPIVMNTQEELETAFHEIETGRFIKQTAKYENQ